MREIWVKADPWKKELVTTALEAGADAVIVSTDKVASVKELGLIKIVSDEGDLKWGKDVVFVEIQSTDDEDEIVKLSRDKKVVVKTTDWTIIPLENLVARTDNILVEVENMEEARTASGILEKGVDGLIINHRDPLKVREIINEIKSAHQVLDLIRLRIDSIHPLGMGDRVCIDTCSMMRAGEGSLVGNSSQAFFLIHAESIENPYVSPRPFRVNAGPVHAYVMVPGGKTRYLSELKAGDEIVGVNAQGHMMNMLVGRVKIERRPLLLVEATGPNGPATTICQNAETIRLVGSEGEAISVVKLSPGDEVLGYVEEAGRHFGHKIKETITEK
ncbi:MAG: 3-dehydroquinate synthase II [Deltaproteobacteria bacterium]|nr:3-dehydroquinate synthase II [Deltaproteobacteria bacterium]